jgi:hypothetical protein
MARVRGARIINMSFGSAIWLHALADKIRYELARSDRTKPIFVSAIGTYACPAGGGKLFPAAMPETISVAGVKEDGTTKTFSSCPGATIGAIVGGADEVETTGPNPETIVGVGAASGGAAIVSGILALIWAAHPNWTADEVSRRLFSSARRLSFPHTQAFSAPNAYTALGGFSNLALRGPSAIEEGQHFRLSAVATGDGPFAYRWSTGATSSSISAVAGPAGSRRAYSVAVTDSAEHLTRTASVVVVSRERGDCHPRPGRPCP